jgi:hypothetical protein
MKISINAFELGELELHLTREPDGSLSLDKGFYAFLDRPGRPHVSLFLEPKPGRSYVEPHFTAARNTRRQFREPLARVEETDLRHGLTQFMIGTMAEVLASLRPIDLDAQEAEGWTVHYLEPRVIRRWIRRGPPWKLNRETIISLARHLRRHEIPAAVLKGLDPSIRREFPALRVDEAGELRARLLLGIPFDLPLSMFIRGPGIPETLPAGWYGRDVPEAPMPWQFANVIAEEHVQAVNEKIAALLARYPLRGAAPDVEASLTGIPSAFSAAFGVYGSDILGWMAEVKEERRRRREVEQDPGAAMPPSGADEAG